MDGQVSVVAEQDGDRAVHGVMGQALEAVGFDGGEGVELAGISDEEGPVKEAGGPQKHVGTHLVGLVDDRPRPSAVGDRGPFHGGSHDDIGRLLEGFDAGSDTDAGMCLQVVRD